MKGLYPNCSILKVINMGFGGATAAMITSLKNNNRRHKREAFDGWKPSDKKSCGIKIEPVSEEVLEQIRHKLRKQKTALKIRWFMVMLLLTTLISGFLFLVT